MLAESQAFALRALGFEYHQPKLSLDDPEATELPMMLLYSPVGPDHRRDHVSRKEARDILWFVYTQLYPEGFSDIETEKARYRAYPRRFFRTRSALLPARVALLEYRGLKIGLKACDGEPGNA